MCRVGRDAGLVRVMGRRRWSEGESGTGHNTAAALVWGVPLVAAVGASGAGVPPPYAGGTQAERFLYLIAVWNSQSFPESNYVRVR